MTKNLPQVSFDNQDGKKLDSKLCFHSLPISYPLIVSKNKSKKEKAQGR